MEQNILIITGTPEANRKVDEMLHEAGFGWIDRDALLPTLWGDSPVRCVCHKGVSGQCVDRGGSYIAYHNNDLTPEIVATFPGAKPLTPKGPFPFEGVEYEIDGDEKRRYKFGDIFLNEDDGEIVVSRCIRPKKLGVGELEAWILRPVISPEKQAALNRFESLKKEVDGLESAIKEMK